MYFLKYSVRYKKQENISKKDKMRRNSGKRFLCRCHCNNIFKEYKDNRLCGLYYTNKIANKNAKVHRYFCQYFHWYLLKFVMSFSLF